MRYARLALLPVLAAVAIAATPVTPRSDMIAIYAMIDKVVVSADSSTIQIWGAFSITERALGDNYRPAQRGYLFFAMDKNNERAVRAEWADLRRAAGKGAPMGFGSKYARDVTLRIRCLTETPANPDPYTTNMGVVRPLSDPPNMSAARIEKDLKSTTIPAVACPK